MTDFLMHIFLAIPYAFYHRDVADAGEMPLSLRTWAASRELWLFRDWDNPTCSLALSIALLVAGALVVVLLVGWWLG